MPLNYYEILGVPNTATPQEIRKAYLMLSLKHHPDKNPDNVEAAQAQFVQIGRAYECLKDEKTRREYDRELFYNRNNGSAGTSNGDTGFASGFGGGRTSATTTNNTSQPQQSNYNFDNVDRQAYENYRDFFDETVAGMSEEDLVAAIGTAAMIGGMIGSLLGSHLASSSSSRARGAIGSSASGGGGGGGGAGSGLLATVGSVVGGMVASELAASSVRALHQSSIQRLEYKQACRIAAERGQPMPEPPPPSNVDQWVGKAIQAVKSAAQNPDQTAKSIGNLWNQALTGSRTGSRTGNRAHPFSSRTNAAAGGSSSDTRETKPTF